MITTTGAVLKQGMYLLSILLQSLVSIALRQTQMRASIRDWAFQCFLTLISQLSSYGKGLPYRMSVSNQILSVLVWQTLWCVPPTNEQHVSVMDRHYVPTSVTLCGLVAQRDYSTNITTVFSDIFSKNNLHNRLFGNFYSKAFLIKKQEHKLGALTTVITLQIVWLQLLQVVLLCTSRHCMGEELVTIS